MYDYISEHKKNKNTSISGPVYFRMWLHIFDFKHKQDRKSALIDLAIYYVIMVALMFLYRWITTFFVGNEVFILWLIFYFVVKIIPLSTYARRIRDVGFHWWTCFFIFIPFLMAVPIVISFMAPYDYSKSRLILLTAFIDGILILTVGIRFFFIDMFFGEIVVKYSTNINDYELYRNDVSYADKHLPETIEGFGNPKEIKFGYKKISIFRFLGFRSHGISLFASYGDNYLEEKERVLNTYEFASYEAVYSDIGFDSFEYKNYNFHIGKNDIGGDYAKELFMIGFDDSNGFISYLYFYDFDLDMVTYYKKSKEGRLKELYEFMDKSFVWLSF